MVAVLLTAVSFVFPVLTVILLVTRPAHGNAATAGTGEERRGTLCSPAP